MAPLSSPSERADLLARKLEESLAEPIPAGTPRRVHGRTTLPGKATAVIGVRRSGKTTFLHQLRAERCAAGVPRERLAYINFEDERLPGLEAADLGHLLEEYYRRFPALRGTETVTWCFDGIHLVPGWERFVRRILDSEKVEVLLSGSSAALLSREVATSMRGRGWAVVLHPFGFEEALRHAGRAIPPPRRPATAAARSAIERALLDYLVAGGFPEAQGLDPATRGKLLADYVDVAMIRDVLERHRVTQPTALRWLVRHLLGNAASLFSVEKFHAALRSRGWAVAKNTVHDLLAHLEDCFLVRTVWLDSPSERRRMVHPRKAYPVDPGLIPVFDRSGEENLGRALETAVLLELERRGCEVSYVRTAGGHEVDFLARRPGGGRELLQVTADARDPGTAERELRALEEAGREYPDARRILLVLHGEGRPADAPEGVEVRTAWEWLLDPEVRE
ncbi:MAG: ATP-binding protein [Planctomycetes bacterium]|nr:ATP-binding protein [Planctomycetota bacterium]